ncbi:MAG: hypothetical protein KatS3mg081_0879 [Gemmatimonadales bacterium]|nr:hypothetical protein HRbin33_00123 [bacterium HR33]GIW51524.1 MAG: hypothetical protein KatS3mg081_0879 [Gemmatimonadales bacterium]
MENTKKLGVGAAVAAALGMAAAMATAGAPASEQGGVALVAGQGPEITVYKSPT